MTYTWIFYKKQSEQKILKSNVRANRMLQNTKKAKSKFRYLTSSCFKKVSHSLAKLSTTIQSLASRTGASRGGDPPPPRDKNLKQIFYFFTMIF